jgi:hypothetical protein
MDTTMKTPAFDGRLFRRRLKVFPGFAVDDEIGRYSTQAGAGAKDRGLTYPGRV